MLLNLVMVGYEVLLETLQQMGSDNSRNKLSISMKYGNLIYLIKDTNPIEFGRLCSYRDIRYDRCDQ